MTQLKQSYSISILDVEDAVMIESSVNGFDPHSWSFGNIALRKGF